ncbi:MAG TPA: DoxX family protein [Chitinophaga sp.]|uniref:DoxX family protein n=1 Tax=Chitinophaga sp. TaxID=1869181 RepID=UPI002DBA5FF5|nr:DoxX family protein [Chitinophaga sp.]HEU4555226.1 DoxX family protein [Chitinophaga sp.]
MRTLINRITATEPRVSPLILRVVFAIVLWPHGAQLLLGCFGGNGFSGTMQYFTTQAGLPSLIAFLVIFLEFFGSLLILFGLFTRLVALASIILFIGMIVTVHQQFGFFMNWYGSIKGEGYEYHLLVIGILLSLVVSGAGKVSLDTLLHKKTK